jgi:hypothetical protein
VIVTAINGKGKHQAVARKIKFWNNTAFNKSGYNRPMNIRVASEKQRKQKMDP